MYGYIYKTTNMCNGKYYIGKHKAEDYDEKYIGSGKALKTAIEKYGKDNFVNEVIDVAYDKNELNRKERYWIEKLEAKKLGYNLSDGGDGGNYSGWKQSNFQKQKASITHKGKRITEKQIEKYRITMANKSIEEKEKIKQNKHNSHVGKSHTEEQKKKCSETLKTKFERGEIKSWRKGNPPWNKGKKLTENQLKNHNTGAGKIHITDGIQNKMIYPAELEYYEKLGYTKGRTLKRRKHA